MIADNDLMAISELLDTKLRPINDELCQVRNGQHRPECRLIGPESSQIQLKSRQTRIEFVLENDVVKRVILRNNIRL